MAAETQYTANTGMVQIATANTNLDGTGTLGTLLTADDNGTLVESITVKATGNTTHGMIRIFLYDGTNTRLLEEIEVIAVTATGSDPTFERTIMVNYRLEDTWVLKVSTEKAETFNVIANAVDWKYYTTTVRPESQNFTANTGMCLIDTANTNRDGTGTLGTGITAGLAASGYLGTRIDSISIKAIESTDLGMVRVFLYDGTNTRLWTEIPVNAVTKSATVQSFYRKLTPRFNLQSDWSIKFSTETGKDFSVIVEGNDWKYPA